MGERGTEPVPRRRLSRERVVTAALEIVDRDGLDGLTMRRHRRRDRGAARPLPLADPRGVPQHPRALASFEFDWDRRFAFGMDALLRGLESLRDTPDAPAGA